MKDTTNKDTMNAVDRMIGFLTMRYAFRYNTVMNCTEFRHTGSTEAHFEPLDPRTRRRIILEVQREGIEVSQNDVNNYIESDYVRAFDPVGDYLASCEGVWDGHDHIGDLARTVPTDAPMWREWFTTWLLAMVAQWQNTPGRVYGNSVAPLLISPQGYNKSTFCRQLLPDALRWGYTDSLAISDRRQVMLAMSQQLLINLDEFNQISPRVQQGFLKNIIQLPSIKAKRPYGTRIEELPRKASFIATSNMTDILADPSGNRRFLGVELTGPIDVSGRLNYEQLYAQAMHALEQGERSYFDASETAVIMQSNRQFEQVSPVKQCFLEFFEPTDDVEKGEYLTATAIFNILKQKIGSSLQITSLRRFGRELQNIDGLKSKRTKYGTAYLVVRK